MVREADSDSRAEIDHALMELDGLVPAGSPSWWTGEDEAAASNMAAARSLGKGGY